MGVNYLSKGSSEFGEIYELGQGVEQGRQCS